MARGTPVNWTPDRIAYLRKRKADGATDAEIANEIGTTARPVTRARKKYDIGVATNWRAKIQEKRQIEDGPQMRNMLEDRIASIYAGRVYDDMRLRGQQAHKLHRRAV